MQKQPGVGIKIGDPGAETLNVINDLDQIPLGLKIEERLYREKEVRKGELRFE